MDDEIPTVEDLQKQIDQLESEVQELMGEVAKAFIILKPHESLNAEILLLWCKENMANYKVPREIEFVTDLPTNAAGKVMKYILKDSS